MPLFLLKKTITPLFYPLSVVFIFLSVGLVSLWQNKRRKTGLVLAAIGLSILLCSSFDFFADGLIRSLENQYPPLMMSDKDCPRDIHWIVVLGGGHTEDTALPVSSQIGKDSLVRLLEGIRLYRKLPGSKLILSGGAVFQKKPEAATMALVAGVMGVPPSDMIKEGLSRDTEDQARFLKDLLGSSPFILVTSAIHMPRSMMAFRSKGLKPIAAPTGHMTAVRDVFHPRRFYPSANTLLQMEMVVHEYLGILWMRVSDGVAEHR